MALLAFTRTTKHEKVKTQSVIGASGSKMRYPYFAWFAEMHYPLLCSTSLLTGVSNRLLNSPLASSHMGPNSLLF